MEDLYYWIWLSILNLKPIEKLKLLEIFKKPKNIYLLKEQELNLVTDSKCIINEILSKENRINAEKVITEVLLKDIEIIKFNETIYSKKLRKIYDYPLILFAKGNKKLLNTESISIVGCRDCSKYGYKISEEFAYKIAQKKITIVSGLARGIDAQAHKGALLANGNTIAVLGSGVEYIYPLENKKLYEQILINNGLIISEFGVSTKPLPKFFPMRNRIISGLSDKILVVEATNTSGSIITANLAIEQGKNVYAIPGNITSTKSSGTNELIKDGAILVSSIEDVINL